MPSLEIPGEPPENSHMFLSVFKSITHACGSCGMDCTLKGRKYIYNQTNSMSN